MISVWPCRTHRPVPPQNKRLHIFTCGLHNIFWERTIRNLCPLWLLVPIHFPRPSQKVLWYHPCLAPLGPEVELNCPSTKVLALTWIYFKLFFICSAGLAPNGVGRLKSLTKQMILYQRLWEHAFGRLGGDGARAIGVFPVVGPTWAYTGASNHSISQKLHIKQPPGAVFSFRAFLMAGVPKHQTSFVFSHFHIK